MNPPSNAAANRGRSSRPKAERASRTGRSNRAHDRPVPQPNPTENWPFPLNNPSTRTATTAGRRLAAVNQTPAFQLDATASGIAEQGSEPSFAERAIQEQLALTAWCSPPADGRTSLTVTFTGKLLKARDNGATTSDGITHDNFEIDKTFERVGRTGPQAVTIRVRDVTAGEWKVSARLREPPPPGGRRRQRRPSLTSPAIPVGGWSLRRRPPGTTGESRAKTHFPPLSLAVGVMPGVWMLMAVAGTALGLLVQQILVGELHPRPSGTLGVSLAALSGAIIVAKAWFVLLHRRQSRFDGWAVQGFVAGFLIVALGMLVGSGSRVGAYFDTASAGLFTGLAVGRVGCFFAGCCSGRPTSSRWGLWSSNQTVGCRRVPTQLMESALAATVATGSGLSVAAAGSRGGWVFVAAIGAYTALRQGVLALRDEARQSPTWSRVVAAAAATAALVAVVAAALV